MINLPIIAEIRYRDAHKTYLPEGHKWWLRDEKGQIVPGWEEGGYQTQLCKQISRTRLIEATYPYAGRRVVWSPPAYANRNVLVRNDRELICASLAATP
jgi:hypothetical protein